MGMITFYARLFIGVLLRILLSSLSVLSRAISPKKLHPNQAGYSQVNPQKRSKSCR